MFPSHDQEDWLDVIELNVQNHNMIHRFLIYKPEIKKYSNLEGVVLDTKEKHLEFIEEIIRNIKTKKNN